MKIKSIPNRTISDKRKLAKNKTVVDKIKSIRFDVDSQQRINESSDRYQLSSSMMMISVTGFRGSVKLNN